MARLAERLGIEVNRPPAREPLPAAYERPRVSRFVAPRRWLLAAYFAAFVVVFALLGGVAHRVQFPVALLCGLSAQLAVERWWRRHRPPELDRRQRLFGPPGSGT